jgi:hypothetical protein
VRLLFKSGVKLCVYIYNYSGVLSHNVNMELS